MFQKDLKKQSLAVGPKPPCSNSYDWGSHEESKSHPGVLFVDLEDDLDGHS